ncbi:uncharacterized protein VTP21DRAFT_3365 [Calcarisporiella thermophila]|uniref:uncharacterized protein n=1 Tax=Calcarisporiella thermophila TaxID=911321 RepID=UPI003742A12A
MHKTGSSSHVADKHKSSVSSGETSTQLEKDTKVIHSTALQLDSSGHSSLNSSWADIASTNTPGDQQHSPQILSSNVKMEKSHDERNLINASPLQQVDPTPAEASNNGLYPSIQVKNDLSKMPSVKEMIDVGEKNSLSESTENLLQESYAEVTSSCVLPENKSKSEFPILGESVKANIQSSDEGLSTMPGAKEFIGQRNPKANVYGINRSFANVAASKLDSAPPSAKPKPIERPVAVESISASYMEAPIQKVIVEEAKNIERSYEFIPPPEVQKHEARSAIDNKEYSLWVDEHPEGTVERDIRTGGAEVDAGESEKREKTQNIREKSVIVRHLSFFDRQSRGWFTVFETACSLRSLGLGVLTSVPLAALIHLNFSPATSSYSGPFLYHNPLHYITLPIYISRLDLVRHQEDPIWVEGDKKAKKERIDQLVVKYGRARIVRPRRHLLYSQEDDHVFTVTGFSFWDGWKRVGITERGRPQWYAMHQWLLPKLLWAFVWLALHDPASGLLTCDACRACLDGTILYRLQQGAEEKRKTGKRRLLLEPERIML